MASKQERIQRQNALLAVHDAATAELMQIPGVVGVGIGLKEIGGELTDQICFRVYVWEKKGASEVPAEERVPAVVQGFPTDVLKVYNLVPSEGFVELQDLSEHRPLKGGVALSTKIMSEKHHEYGTLGWFATKVSDNSNVVLTNAHVLWPDLWNGMAPVVLTDPDKLAQPIYDKTCCCEYHVIGQRIIGIKNNDVDCAIGSLTEEKPALTIGNRSTNRTLRVDGTDVAAVGDPVRKIGARSGYTEGTVIDIGGAAGTVALPGGGTTAVRLHQIIVWPVTTNVPPVIYIDDHFGQPAFMNEGDSGSVLIDDGNNIIGLLFSSDPKTQNRTIGIGNHIDRVLLALKNNGHEIKLAVSPSGGNASGSATGTSVVSWRPSLQDVVRESEALPAALYSRHRDEVTHLVEHRRPVTVAWHRHQGPAFAAAVNRSHRDPAYRIPRAINGVSRHALLVAMGRVLGEHGSPALQQDLRKHALGLIDDLCRAENIRSILLRPDRPAIAPEPVATHAANGVRHGY
jgi:hypothetical protein